MANIPRDIEIKISAHAPKRFTLRVWLGFQIVKLGCWIASGKVIEISIEPGE